jgi:hypothetical protein
MHLRLASIWAILRIVYIERLPKSGKNLARGQRVCMRKKKVCKTSWRKQHSSKAILKDRKRKRTRIQMKGCIQSKTTTQYWTKLLQMEQQIDGQKTGVRLPGHWTRWVLPSLKTTSDLTEWHSTGWIPDNWSRLAIARLSGQLAPSNKFMDVLMSTMMLLV